MKPMTGVQADAGALLAEAEAACARSDHRRGAALARQVIDRAAAAGDVASLACARSVLAQLLVLIGEFETAGRLGRLALDHASEHGPPALIAQACNTLSFVYDRAGLAVLAVEHGLRALEAAREGGDRAAECLALNRVGVAVRGSEESARAIHLLEEAVQIARTLPAPSAAFRALNNLASRWIAEADRLVELGRDPGAVLRAARFRAHEAEAIALATGAPLDRAMISANLAAVHRRLGEFDAARTHFVEAIALARAEGATDHESTFRLALASLEVEAAPSQAGCAALERQLDAFPPGIDSDLQLRARRVLAQAWRALDDPERACTQWERLQADAQAAAGRRADAQWRLMQTREELAQARHEAEHAHRRAEVDRVRAEADAALAREVARHRDRLESEVAARTEDLRQALVAAEAASRTKSAFLALVSHELRTPLNGVLGMVDIARHRSTDPRQLRQLDMALAAGRGLAQLVEQLLEFVADAAPERSVAERTDVRALLGAVVLAAQPQAQDKGLALQVEVGDEVPAVVRMDAARVHRVLGTLIGNALKFSAQGPVRVTAHQAGLTGSGGTERMLVFEVIDHGPGIAPDVLPRLFRPFELGDLSFTRAQGGLGLGLALVGRWVQAMHARIDVDSEPGRGSTFRLSVPVEGD